MATWGDYNNDGYIDVYIVQSNNNNCKLFENDGDGTFTDVTSTAGVTGPASGSSAVWCDVNNDGLQDIFVIGTTNYTSKFYLNEGDGTFEDITNNQYVNVDDLLACSSIAVGDVDNDGDQDFYITRTGSNYLLRNDFNGETVGFTDKASDAGVAGPTNAVDCCFADYDNDGLIDLYVTASDGNSCIYKNGSTQYVMDFDTLDDESGGVNSYNCQGVSAVDIEGDGRQSFYVTRYNGYSAFMEQKVSNGNNWLGIRLDATASNESAIGAKVKITVQEGEALPYYITRTVTAGSGWGSQGALDLHIGLGELEKNEISSFTVYWPSGVYYTVSSNDYDLNEVYQAVGPNIQIHRKKDGEANYLAISNSNNKVLPGEKMDLKLVAQNVTDYEWTLPGEVIGGWTADTDKTYATELGAGDLDNQTVVYYWHDTGDKREVKCEVEIGVKDYTVSVKLHVKKPTYSVTNLDVDEVKVTDKYYYGYGDWGLHFGAETTSPGTPPTKYGFEIKCKVEVPSGFSQGVWQYVQLVKMDVHREDDDTNTAEYDMNGEWVLDTTYPYAGGSWSTGSTERETDDSPCHWLRADMKWLQTNKDEFNMYIMFKPSGSNSIFVPLAVVNWWWKGKGQENGASWDLVVGSDGWSTNPSASDVTTYPVWDKNIANYSWVPE